jgi:hypothetical protein
MKIRNNLFLIAALIFAAFVFATCSDGLDNQGSININSDNASARAYANAENDATMVYTVTLTSPGKAPITRTTNTSVSIPVSEGTWNIKVDAEGERVRGEGNASVAVAAGKPAFANIGMTVTGTRVKNWLELEKDFKELNKTDGELNDLQEIEIVEGFDADSTSEISLNRSKTITLWAKSVVKIQRTNIVNINKTVFTINNGTLILDGNITIQGNGYEKDCRRALINVYAPGTLEMRDGVTLTENYTSNSDSGGLGGGVYVSGGTFIMKGGTISLNKAATKGGGVYVTNRNSIAGTFIKTGGIIENNIAPAQAGSAVYDESGKSSPSNYEENLAENKKWPNPNSP